VQGVLADLVLRHILAGANVVAMPGASQSEKARSELRGTRGCRVIVPSEELAGGFGRARRPTASGSPASRDLRVHFVFFRRAGTRVTRLAPFGDKLCRFVVALGLQRL